MANALKGIVLTPRKRKDEGKNSIQASTPQAIDISCKALANFQVAQNRQLQAEIYADSNRLQKLKNPQEPSKDK